jgi:hypothetical protein
MQKNGEQFEEGQGPHRAVVPTTTTTTMMMMMQILFISFLYKDKENTLYVDVISVLYVSMT